MSDTVPPAKAEPHDQLLETLRALEWALHHPGQRLDDQALEALLHPDFHEVGKSALSTGEPRSSTTCDNIAALRLATRRRPPLPSSMPWRSLHLTAPS